MYLLKLAFRPWRAAPLSQFLAASAAGVLLLLAGILLWMEKGLNPILERLNGEQVITAYLSAGLERADEKTVVDTIRGSLGASAVRDIKLIGSQEFLQHLKGPYPELVNELEGLGSEAETLVPRYVSIAGILSDSDLERVKAIRGVEAAESSRDRYQNVVAAYSALRWIVRFVLLGLALAILTGLVQLSRLNAHLHQEALGFLRLWGASGIALLTPSVLSGMIVGIAAGAGAGGLWIGCVPWLVTKLQALSPVLQQMSFRPLEALPVLFGAGLALGALSGMIAGIWRAPVSAPASTGGRSWL